MIVLVMADFDPAGRQMAVSIARKLQGFRDLHFPDLDVRGPCDRAYRRPGPRARAAVDAAQGDRETRRPLAARVRPRADRDRRACNPQARCAPPDRRGGHRAVLRPDPRAAHPGCEVRLRRRGPGGARGESRFRPDRGPARRGRGQARHGPGRGRCDQRAAEDGDRHPRGSHLTPPEPPAPELPEGMKGKPIIFDGLAMGRPDAVAQGPRRLTATAAPRHEPLTPEQRQRRHLGKDRRGPRLPVAAVFSGLAVSRRR